MKIWTYLEVIVVNDGSKDKTLELAKKYEEKYPDTFKVVDKENGGYGSTINTSISLANGKYFKQLDGDDWYETDNLNSLCLKLKEIDADMIYTPFIKHNVTNEEEEICHNQIEEINETKQLDDIIQYAKPTFYMHTLMYKTSILKDNNIHIDEKCFYTDTEYVLFPIMYCKTFKAINLPIYIYRCGDENQSVGKLGRRKHYQDHLKMSNRMLEQIEIINCIEDNKREYCHKYLASIFASGIANYLMTLKPTKQNYLLIKDYDKKVKENDEDIYNKMEDYSKTVKVLRRTHYLGYILINIIKNVK